MRLSRVTLESAAVAVFAAVLVACSGGSASTAGVPLAPSSRAQQPPNNSLTWWMYYYNPSGNSLSRVAASYSTGVASFSFAPGVFTPLLMSKAPSLTGNLTGDTLNDTITVSGATRLFQSLFSESPS